MYKVLLIDDEPQDHAFLNITLPPYCELYSCYTGHDALDLILQRKPDIVLVDVYLPDINGIELLRICRSKLETHPVYVMVSGYKDPELIVEAVKSGASDYLVKPYNMELVKNLVRKHLRNHPLQGSTFPPPQSEEFGLIGNSEGIRRVRDQIRRFGPAEGTVLITGESGTGKELIARALHQLSQRKEGPYVPVNCGAIPETIFESELFGSDRGAFTDATNRFGLFEAANNGTLFLDEVGELPPQVQVKLLRVLEDREIRHIGSSKTRKINVRVLSATNQDLFSNVGENRFRRDLYYRLNVFRIVLPPLRDRKEDIPLLAYYFLRNQNKTLMNCAMEKLLDHSWPGNVRELKNVIERAVYLADATEISPELITF